MARRYFKIIAIGQGTAGVADDFVKKLRIPYGMTIVPGSVIVRSYTALITRVHEPTASASGTQVAHDDGSGLFVADGGALIDVVNSYVNYTTGMIRILEGGAVFAATDYCTVYYECANSVITALEDWELITYQATRRFQQKSYRMRKEMVTGSKVLTLGKYIKAYHSMDGVNHSPLAYRLAGANWPESLANDVSMRAVMRCDAVSANVFANAPTIFARRDPALNASGNVSGYWASLYSASGHASGSGVAIWAGTAASAYTTPAIAPLRYHLLGGADTWLFAVGKWIGMRLDITNIAGPYVNVKVYLLIGAAACEQFFDAAPPWVLAADFDHYGATYLNNHPTITPVGSTYAPVVLVGGVGYAVGRVNFNSTLSTYFAAFQARK